MTDQLLLVSRIALLALVYLVFARVARAVMVEVRAESGVRSGRAEPAEVSPSGPAFGANPQLHTQRLGSVTTTAHRLILIAPSSRAGSSFPLESEITIGRAPGCAVSIDDSRVSKLHARVYEADGRWILSDLGSTNGTIVNGQPCNEPHPLSPRDQIVIGDVVMEFE